MSVKTLAFSSFNRHSHLSIIDHECHLLSWMHIKLCDVGASQRLGLLSLYFTSCEDTIQTEMHIYHEIDDINIKKMYTFINKN